MVMVPLTLTLPSLSSTHAKPFVTPGPGVSKKTTTGIGTVQHHQNNGIDSRALVNSAACVHMLPACAPVGLSGPAAR